MTNIHNRFRRIGNWMTDANQGGEFGQFLKNSWRRVRGTGVLKGLFIVVISSAVTLWIRYSSDQPQVWYEILLNDADAISLTTVGIIFILESGERKKRSHYEAWQVIDNAGSGSIKVSFARKKALEDLCQDGVSLTGVELKCADLKGINLKGANLERADFSGANLESANLVGAKLQGAKFHGWLERPYTSRFSSNEDPVRERVRSTLQNVNFNGADLKEISFQNLDLSYSSLIKADLRGANLIDVNFSGANLTEAKLQGACLDDADLREAKFSVHQLAEARLRNTKLPEELAHLSNRDCETPTGTNLIDQD